MRCGCRAVGLKKIWINLRDDVLVWFRIKVQCFNQNCRENQKALVLVGKTGITCKEVKARKCCSNPRLHLRKFTISHHNYEEPIKIDLDDLYYSQNKCSKAFKTGETIKNEIKSFIATKCTFQEFISTFPTINVVFKEDRFYSLDNRRLYLFKRIQNSLIENEEDDDEDFRITCNLKKYSLLNKTQRRKFTTENKGETIGLWDIY